MITANRYATQPPGTAPRQFKAAPTAPGWQQQWRDSITDPLDLLAMLGLADHADRLLPRLDTGFALRVPHAFVARMRRGDPSDPLLLQVLPQIAELDEVDGYSHDAVGDLHARSGRGVLQKYQGRALLIATGSCAINCRYCFRRHFPYAEETAAAGQWRNALSTLRTDASIDEAILSGGDPLSLTDAKLAQFGDELNSIEHVRRLRIHTRLPVVMPARIDASFCTWLQGQPQQKIVVLHINHANEIDNEVKRACRDLAATGTLLLNQSVLLRGVNDSVGALQELSERLIVAGVLPYYLHQLDRVAGTAHFSVDDERAIGLVNVLRARVAGYLLPRLVREIPSAEAKTPL